MINGITSENYYFLLEWKDKNMDDFVSMYGGLTRLCELTTYELNKLLEAIKAETKQVEKVKPKCLECQSTNIRVAIHTLYKECNERYNFWEQAD